MTNIDYFDYYDSYYYEEEEYNHDDDYDQTSCTNRDYGPSNPWDAPGMSVHDFI